MKTNLARISRIPLATVALLALSSMVLAQAPGAPGRRPAAPEPAPTPVVAAIPTIKPLIGPGKVYDSASALWPGKGLEQLNYEVNEY
ncbi:MAG: hypothetical protein ABI645_17275, partial [Pseudomonadota bacterium]